MKDPLPPPAWVGENKVMPSNTSADTLVIIINEMKIKSISDYDINNAISKINKNDYLNKIQILSEKKLMQIDI